MTRIKRVLTDGRTWGSLIYMILQLPLGIIYFTVVVVLGVTSGSVIAGAFYELSTGKNVVRLDGYPELDALFNTPHGLVLLVVAGMVGILFTLHLARVIGLHSRQDCRGAARSRLRLTISKESMCAAPFSLRGHPVKVSLYQTRSRDGEGQAEGRRQDVGQGIRAAA